MLKPSYGDETTKELSQHTSAAAKLTLLCDVAQNSGGGRQLFCLKHKRGVGGECMVDLTAHLWEDGREREVDGETEKSYRK